MSMRVKIPKYILLGTNNELHVESPRRSDKQGTLMYSHYLMARDLTIKACKAQGTEKVSSLDSI
jgi:hypothetical protein